MRLLWSGQWILECWSWSVDPDMWILICGSWSVSPDLWILVCGYWLLDPGRWLLIYGSWSVDPVRYILVAGSVDPGLLNCSGMRRFWSVDIWPDLPCSGWRVNNAYYRRNRIIIVRIIGIIVIIIINIISRKSDVIPNHLLLRNNAYHLLVKWVASNALYMYMYIVI